MRDAISGNVFAFCLMTTALFVTLGDEEKVRVLSDNRNRFRSDDRSNWYRTRPKRRRDEMAKSPCRRPPARR